jgi:acetyl-CoA carboxylase carboxyl transferase subunit alpha
MQTFDFEKPLLDYKEKIDKTSEALKRSRNVRKEVVERRISIMNAHLESLKKEVYSGLSNWNRVQISRHPDRPMTLDFIHNISTDFIEFHGDRCSGNCKAIVSGFAMFEGESVLFVGHQKGKDAYEKQIRNFGMSNPEGFRKALRLMILAERFQRPVITFIDTPGASPGVYAEERGLALALSENMQKMLRLRVPVISVLIGEGTSGGALGIGVCDRMLMFENAWLSLISPEMASHILWKSYQLKEKAADVLKICAHDLKELKLIDDIIQEAPGGMHHEPELSYKALKTKLIECLKEVKNIPAEERIQQRLMKYSSIGIQA